jgi:hypothetical protein
MIIELIILFLIVVAYFALPIVFGRLKKKNKKSKNEKSMGFKES